METPEEIAERWRGLRQLLRDQLERFEGGRLAIHSGADDVSAAAIARLKQEIEDFDRLISRSDKRRDQEAPCEVSGD